MKSNSRAVWSAVVVALVLLIPVRARAVIAIERATDSLRVALRDAAPGSDAARKIADLEAAIARGENASSGLRQMIARLETEKRELERIQTALTSGIVGALTTAIVAIIGALVSLRNSRADRNLKRLQVIEKAAELSSRGIELPADLKLVVRSNLRE
jgi:hypothetical protein